MSHSAIERRHIGLTGQGAYKLWAYYLEGVVHNSIHVAAGAHTVLQHLLMDTEVTVAVEVVVSASLVRLHGSQCGVLLSRAKLSTQVACIIYASCMLL